MRVEQEPGALDRVAGDADDTRLLLDLLAILAGIDHAIDLALVVMGDGQHLRVGPQFEIAGRLAIGNLGIERRPFGARFAALETEADLQARAAAFARLRIDRHASGMDFLIAELLCTRFEHLEIVVAGETRDVVGARRAHLVFGLGVPGLHLGERQRPVEQIGAGHVAIGGLGLELVILETQRRAGPVDRRAADRLDDPGGQAGKVGGDAPASRRRALVEPGQLA
jgi:hypothetical protein